VSILFPTTNSVVGGPTNLVIQVSATDSDGTIARVDFFLGTAQAGTLTNGPFNLALTNLTAGNYNVHARATDNFGGTTDSGVVAFKVGSSMVAPQVLGDGSFQFTLDGSATGVTNLIQVSTDLVNWTTIRTNVFNGGPVQFTDSASAGAARRYYRVVQAP